MTSLIITIAIAVFFITTALDGIDNALTSIASSLARIKEMMEQRH